MIRRTEQENDLRSRYLAETLAWSNARANPRDPAGSLRSESLKPALVIADDRTHGHWNYDLPDDPTSYVFDLCERRGELLRATGLQIDHRAEARGRILLFYPYETLCDGAAHDSSRGYFDWCNIPPWDTWSAYERLSDERHVLYSYVPPQLVDIANLGVSVNPEQCIQWEGGPS
jgi:hypothetical protein